MDDACFDVKTLLVDHVLDSGHEVDDQGADPADVSAGTSAGYPGFGITVAGAVAEGELDRGVCISGTGTGTGFAVTKGAGVRSAVVHDVATAGLDRRHNDAAVVCLGGRRARAAGATDTFDTFFTIACEGGCHQSQLGEISQYASSRSEIHGITSRTSGEDHERQRPNI
ncbi:MAG: RpiB/LacA/LacB family sugar-phosphate isomerase [Acidimicrobiales bacterium]